MTQVDATASGLAVRFDARTPLQADALVRVARERPGAALLPDGLRWPHGRRVADGRPRGAPRPPAGRAMIRPAMTARRRARLLLAALAVLAACDGGDPVILSLEGERVRRSDFERYVLAVEARGLGPVDPAAREGLLDAFLEQRALVIEARQRGLLAPAATRRGRAAGGGAPPRRRRPPRRGERGGDRRVLPGPRRRSSRSPTRSPSGRSSSRPSTRRAT